MGARPIRLFALVLAAILVPLAAAAEKGPADVVILSPGQLPAYLVVQERLRAALSSPSVGPVQIHTEFLEEARFPGDGYGGVSAEASWPIHPRGGYDGGPTGEGGRPLRGGDAAPV